MIRPFSLRDVHALLHLQARVAVLDIKRRLLNSPNPTREALLSLVSGHCLGSRTLIHTGASDTGLAAFAQFVPREDGTAWDAVCIAPVLDDAPDAAGLWHDLFAEAVLTAAKQGVARVYASVSPDGAAAAALRHSGFAVVGCEEVFVSRARPEEAPCPPAMRHATSGDAWALSELRRQVIPPLVYHAQWFAPEEALASAQALGAGRSGYVWVENGAVVAHMSLESSSHGRWIECIVRPERRGDLLPYLRHLLYLAEGSKERPVYVSVPEYVVGLGWLLRTLGFETCGRQQVMVAHTVSRVKVTSPAVAHGLDGRADVVAH